MKTYVINMEKDILKRQNILSQLEKQPTLDFEIIKACEGRLLDETTLKEWGYPLFKEKYKQMGTLPAFGCAISHYSVYNKVVDNNLDFALILEDDAILSQELSKNLKQIEIYLAQVRDPAIILLTPDFIYSINEKPLFLFDQFKLMSLWQGYMSTGYIVNKSAALLLKDRLFPIRYFADEWGVFKKLGLKIQGVIPHLISYSGELGEIGTSQLRQDESIFIRFRHFLGRLKAKLYEVNRERDGYRRSKRIW